MRKLFLKSILLLCALIVGSSSVWGENASFTITRSSFAASTGYGNYSWSAGGISGTGQIYGTNEDEMQMNGGNDNGKLIYNTSAIPGNLKKINIIRSSGSNRSYSVYGRTSAYSGTGDYGTFISTANISDGTGRDYTVSSGSYNYFVVVAASSKAAYLASITVTYEMAEKVDPSITFNDGSVRVGQNLDLSSLFTSNSEGAVTYSIVSGDTYASLVGSTLTGIAEGSVSVQAAQAASGIYNAKNASATITINPAKVLSSIAVTTEPTKTTYTEGDTFDPTGIVVTATYADESTDVVTALCTFTPSSELTTSDIEITISYTEGGVNKTTTQAIIVNEVVDYATLPFIWAGGGKTALKATTGVTTSSLDSDYADSNAPYQVKFNGDGKFIIIKTNCQPGQVTMGVKMIGGATTSTMTIQESADGETYTDVQALSISGSSNDVVDLKSTKPFKADTRYIKFLYTKGSNVGVGPIAIYPGANITIASACTDGKGHYYATYSNSSAFVVLDGITVSAVKITNGHLDLSATYSTGDVVAANTGVLITSDSAGDKLVALTDSAGTSKDGNHLYPGGVTAEEMATAHPSCKYYKLALKKDDGDGYVANTAGFYWGADGGDAFASSANKAYLAIPTGASAPSHFMFNEEVNGATNIENIEASDKAVKFIENGRILIKKNGIVYDALGRIVK